MKLLQKLAARFERYRPPDVAPFNKLDGSHTIHYIYASQFLENRKVLDAGCGCGYGSVFLADIANHVVALDKCKAAVATAKKRAGNYVNVHFVVGDCECLPFTCNVFDATVCFEVIEHLRNYRKFMHGVYDSIREGGFLMLSTPNRNCVYPHPFHMHEFSFEELKNLLSQRFRQIEVLGINLVNREHIQLENKFRRSFKFKVAFKLFNSKLKPLLFLFYLLPAQTKRQLLPNYIPEPQDYQFSKSPHKAPAFLAVAHKLNVSHDETVNMQHVA